jgi:hypothetical protein
VGGLATYFATEWLDEEIVNAVMPIEEANTEVGF